MPLLSICIPTYNRAEFLAKTLDSIVGQSAFKDTEEVEIVISDNCSTDNTAQVAKSFVDVYAGKIFYHKTSENLGFGNFCEVLSVAHGKFRKLNNDTLLNKANSLDVILDRVRANVDGRPILFFPNGSANKGVDVKACNDLDEFVDTVSYFSTWIGAFGIWEDDLERCIRDFEDNRSTEIPQTYVLMKLMSDGSKAIVDNRVIFESQSPSKKGGYNIAQVFGYNYNRILHLFHEQRALSDNVYEKARKNILPFVNYYYFDVKKEFAFDKTGYLKWMWPIYGRKAYFYLSFFQSAGSWLKWCRKHLKRKLSLRKAR